MNKELKINCILEDDSMCTISFECNCNENYFANMLREIILHTNRGGLIRKDILLSVLEDVINEIS